MSGVRFALVRLFLAAPFLLLACTKPTPGYCDKDTPCTGGGTCTASNFCTSPIVEAGQDGGVPTDAPVDRPIDAPADTATGDAPRDASDGGDARADAGEVHTGCNTNNDCRSDAGTPVCQFATGRCVGCLVNSDCRDPQAAVCDSTATTCVQCLLSRDCTDPTAPICDGKICRGCRTDSDCAGIGPEVCMSHIDGHCATDDETVYVLNQPGTALCSDSAATAGSRALPYCQSQPAVDSAVASHLNGPDAGTRGDSGADAAAEGGADARRPLKDLIVMRGPSLTPLALSASDLTLSVVGQSNATVLAGGFVGVHVSDGTVYIRGLRVNGGATNPGIIADGGEIHLDRCLIDGNMGGVLIDGAPYEITNTIIANNSGTTRGSCGAWGGVCIANVGTAKLSRFLNNTVAANGQVGIACNGPYPIVNSIATGSGGGIDTVVCAFSACCGADPVNLDPQTYHLRAGSSCIDKLSASVSTAYDIDGDKRPSGALSDCGADEYVAPPMP